MELIIALSIIFSIIALSIAIYTAEELMKLRDSTKHIIDIAQRVIDINNRLIEYIDVLENRTKKEAND